MSLNISKVRILVPPVPKRVKTDVWFGNVNPDRGENAMDPPISREDHYFWMRDDDRQNQEVLDYLKKENKYTDDVMSDTKKLQETLREEMISRMVKDDKSYPSRRGEGGWDNRYAYYSETPDGMSYPIYHRIDTQKGDDIVLFDVNKLAGDKLCDVSWVTTSHDHSTLAYAVDFEGSEDYDIHFINIESGREIYKLNKKLPYGAMEWSNDKNVIIYTLADNAKRMNQVWIHNIQKGTHKLLIQEDDPLLSLSAGITEDGKYLVISSGGFNSTQGWIKDISGSSDSPLMLIKKRVEGTLYSIDVHEENVILTINDKGSTNFRLIIKRPEYDWMDMWPYDENIHIDGLQCFKDFLAISIRKNGNKTVVISKYNNGDYGPWEACQQASTAVPSMGASGEELFGNIDAVCDISLSANNIYDATKLWLVIETPIDPYQLVEIDVNSMETTVLKTKETPNYDSLLYECKRVWVSSHDGVKVPMTLIYRKDRMDTPSPCHLYGYGAYGLTDDSYLNTKLFSLIDKGYVYATAHVRGSCKLGQSWYEAGKMRTKMNTFLDFTACAEYLIKNEWTTSKQLSIEGRSAGGLLVGAAMTMRPELFNCVIGGVPFLDVLNTMSDETIPLTTPEWQQWGNPNCKEDFEYMAQYSPYDNIKDTDYPNSLMTGGHSDPRVQYWEPSKFNAKIRHYSKDKNHHLLKIKIGEGHFGTSQDRYKYCTEKAFEYAFLLWHLK
jgi:oligopeptidase B